MKKLIFILLLINVLELKPYAVNGQYVMIPDTNFINVLVNNGYSACVVGNQLDTTCNQVLTANSLNINSANLHDLTGIQYFKNLQYLEVEENALTTLPLLPPRLKLLNCNRNEISFISSIPDSLLSFVCNSNQLTSLPSLPPNLRILECAGNQLSSLPVLPSTLEELYFFRNNINLMPVLPAGLKILGCGFNPIASISSLPTSLISFLCDSTLQNTLPALPPHLEVLSCSENSLTSLPSLPQSLVTLDCSGCQLTALPALPPKIWNLHCGSNFLTALPALPDTLSNLSIQNNPGITCLPPISCIGCTFQMSGEFMWYNTGIECWPNAIATGSLVPNITPPICDVINVNDCPVNWNLKGAVGSDIDLNCLIDSMEPIFERVKINLYQSGSLIQQTYSSALGEFSFATDTGVFVCMIDTVSSAASIQCPVSFYYNANISAATTYYDSLDFALACKQGVFDVGVSSVVLNSGIFRPANWAEVSVLAGDLSNQYDLNCALGISGTVTVIIQGPADFSGVSSGARIPVVSGDTLVYTITDFGNVNFFEDFRFSVQTDTLAQLGDQVCFAVIVAPVAGEYTQINNYYSHCFTVVNSYDPNDKQVSPTGQIDTSQYWLTYTIRFQNTGNAPAQHVYIIDSLDQNIDENSFQLLAFSHEPHVQVIGNIVKFSFANINLPDSVNNEPESHGYIQYKVRRNINLSIGTQIRNIAYIYFDFNPPVLTNTTINTIAVTGTVGIQSDLIPLEMTLYPNPVSSGSKLYLKFSNVSRIDGVINLFEIGGRCVYSQRIISSDKIQELTLADLEAGIYLAVFENGTNRIQKKLILLR